MKKQLQILITIIGIIFFSCGKQNANNNVVIKKGVKELSANGSSASSAPNLLLISPEEQIRFNADRKDLIKKLQDEVSAGNGASYIIDRSELTKTISKLNSPYIVN